MKRLGILSLSLGSITLAHLFVLSGFRAKILVNSLDNYILFGELSLTFLELVFSVLMLFCGLGFLILPEPSSKLTTQASPNPDYHLTYKNRNHESIKCFHHSGGEIKEVELRKDELGISSYEQASENAKALKSVSVHQQKEELSNADMLKVGQKAVSGFSKSAKGKKNKGALLHAGQLIVDQIGDVLDGTVDEDVKPEKDTKAVGEFLGMDDSEEDFGGANLLESPAEIIDQEDEDKSLLESDQDEVEDYMPDADWAGASDDEDLPI